MEILPKVTDRIKGEQYLFKGRIVVWSGKELWCEHSKQKCHCRECGGTIFCEHDRRKNHCRDCDGTSICEHGKIISHCIRCEGSSICEHKRDKRNCKDCNGTGICVHKRIRTKCKECHGGSICLHNFVRSRCKDCKGGSICIHNKDKGRCKECCPNQYLASLMRVRVTCALNNYENRSKKHTFEYVGCNLQELREHLEKQFTIGMSWENQGQWHIDHIRPCASFDLSKEEERHKCFHYTNLQPLWASDNLSKGSKYCQEITNK